MAEHTKAHLWLNTTIAILALAASGLSGVFSWRMYDLKREAVGFGALLADCELEVKAIGPETVLGLCWNVLIVNQSDVRTSIVWHDVVTMAKQGERKYGGFTSLQNDI